MEWALNSIGAFWGARTLAPGPPPRRALAHDPDGCTAVLAPDALRRGRPRRTLQAHARPRLTPLRPLPRRRLDGDGVAHLGRNRPRAARGRGSLPRRRT